MKTFWDFCAPFYDFAEKRVNGLAYNHMLNTVQKLIPDNATVLEAAAGTGEISIAAAKKANYILCTDVSNNMLAVTKRKIKKHSIKNIKVSNRSIYALLESDSSYDVVVAGQVLHLIDEPEKAAMELRRVAKEMVILPISFTKNLSGMKRFLLKIYRLLGFAPKIELSEDEYQVFLNRIGFSDCECIYISGKVPMAVAVWKKAMEYST